MAKSSIPKLNIGGAETIRNKVPFSVFRKKAGEQFYTKEGDYVSADEVLKKIKDKAIDQGIKEKELEKFMRNELMLRYNSADRVLEVLRELIMPKQEDDSKLTELAAERRRRMIEEIIASVEAEQAKEEDKNKEKIAV